jgi:paraquat-inducible protein B
MKNILFSFDDMKAGDKATKRLSQAFTRAGANVISTAIDPRTKRTAGISYREVAMTFADGQQVTLLVKQTGDVFQAKVNGKVVPLKNPDDHGKAVAELVKDMDAGRAKFQATLAKTRAALPKGIKASAPKMEAALQERASSLEAELATAEQTRDALKAELGDSTLDAADDKPSGEATEDADEADVDTEIESEEEDDEDDGKTREDDDKGGISTP